MDPVADRGERRVGRQGHAHAEAHADPLLGRGVEDGHEQARGQEHEPRRRQAQVQRPPCSKGPARRAGDDQRVEEEREQGSHDELVRIDGGIYRTLFELQAATA